ncbi:nucleoside diphosphate kinase [Catenaria anguillulae PL171]|uniref:Nucleoside diphosphate kinase n=1 Tax=Catenaria anguillulae PL171 TaxID=765915 RepID=A0A1Y2HSH9_9FUNG|nr:nucleoside diphosphate kinase [Catenaria anguillulae PL171]
MERTLAIIKPDAVQHVDDIVYAIEADGFTIIDKQHIHLTIDQARDFYAEHNGKPFFEPLTKFMSSGPIYVMILSRENAIARWRRLLGPTDSVQAREAAPHSIRARFGTDNQRNACHGSDSRTSADREIRFFFPNATVEPLPNSAQIATFLESAVYPVLTKGLVALCTEKPSNPTEWLGRWLLHNNPNKPRTVEPSQ